MASFDYDLGRNDDGSYLVDPTLQTAVLVSYCTRARANPEDHIQDPSDLGGWWGDTYSETPGYSMGSVFWTFAGLHMSEALERAEPAARRALQWMLDKGLVERLEFEVEAVTPVIVGIRTGIVEPGGELVRWLDLWQFSIA